MLVGCFAVIGSYPIINCSFEPRFCFCGLHCVLNHINNVLAYF